MPIAVGFGIKTEQQVRAVASVADAAVVGSALIERIKAGLEQSLKKDEIAAEVHHFVSELARGCVGSNGNAANRT